MFPELVTDKFPVVGLFCGISTLDSVSKVTHRLGKTTMPNSAYFLELLAPIKGLCFDDNRQCFTGTWGAPAATEVIQSPNR